MPSLQAARVEYLRRAPLILNRRKAVRILPGDKGEKALVREEVVRLWRGRRELWQERVKIWDIPELTFGRRVFLEGPVGGEVTVK